MSQKFNSSPKAGRLETQEELMFQIGSKRQGIKMIFQFKGSQVAGISLNLGYVCGGWGAGVCCFVLLKPSTDCMGSTHIMESSLLYSFCYSVPCSVMSGSFATPWTVAHQAPLSVGILQARILEWVAMPFSRGTFLTQGSNLGLLHCRWILYCWTTGEAPISIIFNRNAYNYISIIFIQKHPHRNTQNNIWPYIWASMASQINI